MWKSIISGRISKNVEVKDVNGKKVLSFTVVNNDNSYKDQSSGEWVEKPVFVECTLWSPTEKAVAYLENRLLKGATVIVEGQSIPRAYIKDNVAVAIQTINVYSDGIDIISLAATE